MDGNSDSPLAPRLGAGQCSKRGITINHTEKEIPMNTAIRRSAATSLLLPLGLMLFLLPGCSTRDADELKKFTDERAAIETNLATIDTLDYTVFSNQKWTKLH
jgi:hypothetical protein